MFNLIVSIYSRAVILALIIGLFSSPHLNAAPLNITEQQFEAARVRVKQQYVGHEKTIDSIFDQTKPWFLYPDTRIKPLVIMMVGPTSVGKTSLVKALVKAFNLEHSFQYFDMDRFSSDKTEWHNGFLDRLTNGFTMEDIDSELDIPKITIPENPVIMLDEIQKVNTLEDGRYKERPNAQAIWELLGNDGEVMVNNPQHEYLRHRAHSYANGQRGVHIPRELAKASEEEKEAYRNQQNETVAKKVRAMLETLPAQVPLNLQHSLIFISGNLDHVFEGANVFDQEQLTADQLHKLTASVTVTDVKNGLGKIFRAEHVSRLGNRIIVVPSLSEDSFRKLIDKRLKEVKEVAREKFGLELSFTERFKRRIFEEGVIPTQGPRPLIATVSNFAIDPLGEIVSSIKNHPDYTQVNPAVVAVDITPKGKTSTWTFQNGPLAGQFSHHLVPSDFLKAQSLAPEPARSITAVRLAGTTTVYAKLTQRLVERVRAKSRSSNRYGFIEYPLPVALTDNLLRSELIDRVAIMASGYVAENMIFGEASMGSQADISNISTFVHKMVAYSGLGGTSEASFIVPPYPRSAQAIEREMNAIMDEAKIRAYDAIAGEREFFAKLAKELTKRNEISKTGLEKFVESFWTDRSIVSALLEKVSSRQSKCEKILTDLGESASDFQFKVHFLGQKKIGY